MDSIGRPPQQYNPNVHGPYNPGTYYGKGIIIFKIKFNMNINIIYNYKYY